MDNTKLIAALEKATGPDRELDFALLCLVDPRAKETSPMHYDPHFTASIDAALTLVPEGWETAIYLGGENVCVQMETEAMRQAIYFEPLEAIAATPALAICIAALRARGEP